MNESKKSPNINTYQNTNKNTDSKGSSPNIPHIVTSTNNSPLININLSMGSPKSNGELIKSKFKIEPSSSPRMDNKHAFFNNVAVTNKGKIREYL